MFTCCLNGQKETLGAFGTLQLGTEGKFVPVDPTEEGGAALGKRLGRFVRFVRCYADAPRNETMVEPIVGWYLQGKHVVLLVSPEIMICTALPAARDSLLGAGGGGGVHYILKGAGYIVSG